MDNKATGGGFKVTYIETQFVTSDAAGFKDLVQRLTGRSAPLPPMVPHRPQPSRLASGGGGGGGGRSRTAPGAGGAQHYLAGEVVVGGHQAVVSRAPPPCLALQEELRPLDMGDFSDLFYAGASERERRGGGYSINFPY